MGQAKPTYHSPLKPTKTLSGDLFFNGIKAFKLYENTIIQMQYLCIFFSCPFSLLFSQDKIFQLLSSWPMRDSLWEFFIYWSLTIDNGPHHRQSLNLLQAQRGFFLRHPQLVDQLPCKCNGSYLSNI